MYQIPNLENLIKNIWDSQIDYDAKFRNITELLHDDITEMLSKALPIRILTPFKSIVADIAMKSIDRAHSSYDVLTLHQWKIACCILEKKYAN